MDGVCRSPGDGVRTLCRPLRFMFSQNPKNHEKERILRSRRQRPWKVQVFTYADPLRFLEDFLQHMLER